MHGNSCNHEDGRLPLLGQCPDAGAWALGRGVLPGKNMTRKGGQILCLLQTKRITMHFLTPLVHILQVGNFRRWQDMAECGRSPPSVESHKRNTMAAPPQTKLYDVEYHFAHNIK
jgi:hypothetical protein